MAEGVAAARPQPSRPRSGKRRDPANSGDAANAAVALLDRCVLFQALDADDRRTLGARARRRFYAAGDTIFRLGDIGQSMMAVASGTVRISFPNPQGGEIVLADLGPHDVFGEVALLDGRERSAAATALTACELLVLERRDVVPFLEQRPTACLRLLDLLCARLRRSDERMSDIAFTDLSVRLAKTLLRRCPEVPAGETALVTLSQAELAGMSGGSRENVNRVLRDWQRRGIVKPKRGAVAVLDRAGLARLAGSP